MFDPIPVPATDGIPSESITAEPVELIYDAQDYIRIMLTARIEDESGTPVAPTELGIGVDVPAASLTKYRTLNSPAENESQSFEFYIQIEAIFPDGTQIEERFGPFQNNNKSMDLGDLTVVVQG